MNIKNIIKIGLLVLMISPTLLNAAEVRSISREIKSTLEKQTIWTVYIKCADVSEDRAIERYENSRKWCAEDIPTMCAKQKVKIAKKVCGTHYERLVNEFRLAKAKDQDLNIGSGN